MDYVAKRGWFFLASLIALLPGVVFLIIAPGLKPGIDFTGGSTFTFEFSGAIEQEDLRGELAGLGHADATVQQMDDNVYFVRTKELDDKNALLDPSNKLLRPDLVQVLSFDLVSPVVAFETVRNAIIALVFAAVGIFLYLWWAFRNVPSPFRYGTAAVITLIHDTMAVVGVFAILGKLYDVEVNTMFLIALLTVIGYSVNDTIVIFDRIRENILLYPNRTLAANANRSISESLGRSLNTSLTLLFTILALLLIGGPTIQAFLWVLLIGVAVGTYSSIGIATNVLVAWESGDPRRLFGPRSSPAPSSPE